MIPGPVLHEPVVLAGQYTLYWQGVKSSLRLGDLGGFSGVAYTLSIVGGAQSPRGSLGRDNALRNRRATV